MRTQNQNLQNINTEQLTLGSWKQKIEALDQLAQQIKLREFTRPSQHL